MTSQEWTDERIRDTHKTLVLNHMLSWTHAVTKIARMAQLDEERVREIVRGKGN